jgi:hypothetical protein
VSVALEARLLRRRPLGGGNRFEPLIGKLLATFDEASVAAFDKSLLGALNSGELSAQVIGLSLVEVLFVEQLFATLRVQTPFTGSRDFASSFRRLRPREPSPPSIG